MARYQALMVWTLGGAVGVASLLSSDELTEHKVVDMDRTSTLVEHNVLHSQLLEHLREGVFVSHSENQQQDTTGLVMGGGGAGGAAFMSLWWAGVVALSVFCVFIASALALDMWTGPSCIILHTHSSSSSSSSGSRGGGDRDRGYASTRTTRGAASHSEAAVVTDVHKERARGATGRQKRGALATSSAAAVRRVSRSTAASSSSSMSSLLSAVTPTRLLRSSSSSHRRDNNRDTQSAPHRSHTTDLRDEDRPYEEDEDEQDIMLNDGYDSCGYGIQGDDPQQWGEDDEDEEDEEEQEEDRGRVAVTPRRFALERAVQGRSASPAPTTRGAATGSSSSPSSSSARRSYYRSGVPLETIQHSEEADTKGRHWTLEAVHHRGQRPLELRYVQKSQRLGHRLRRRASFVADLGEAHFVHSGVPVVGEDGSGWGA